MPQLSQPGIKGYEGGPVRHIIGQDDALHITVEFTSHLFRTHDVTQKPPVSSVYDEKNHVSLSSLRFFSSQNVNSLKVFST